MSLSIKSHLQVRIAALFVGFFGGAIAYSLWGSHLQAGRLSGFLMPLIVFGGAFLLPLAFSAMVSADCPKCGSDSAVPVSAKSTVYVCKACGTETNALGALMGVDAAAMAAAAAAARAAPVPTPEEEKKKASRFGILFLLFGLLAIGIAVWLGQDSIRLLREGLSTDAKVLRVTHELNRGSKDNETRHTAFVEYQVGGQARTLQRSWSSESGSFWTWPNYRQGERLRVLYLPSDPGTASIDTWAELFMTPIFLTLFGVVFSVVGVAMMTYRRKPEEASDGAMLLDLDGQPQQAQQPKSADSPSWNFLRFAIGAAIFLAGAGAFYYFAIVQPKIERERIEREAAIALQEAAQARAEAAKAAAERAAAAAERAAAARAAAAKPVEARADMSECQLLLLRQRNEYAAKYPEYSRAFFNIRPPKGGDCKDCLAALTGKLQAWAGFDVAPRAYIMSDYRPGCVAYRQDIFGTAEGAKCLAAFLGSGYSPDQSCQADGFPYTIIHPAP